eukprot:g253.t1
MSRILPFIIYVVALLGVTYVTCHEAEDAIILDGSVFGAKSAKKFTSILAFEGGGARSIIGVMSLLELENSIKRHILLSKPEMLPESYAITSIDDFEVQLADFIDIISGSAFGSWVSLYLATKGSKGSLSETLKQTEIIERYGKSVPGTAKALIVFFNEYMEIVYPAVPAPPPVDEVGPPPAPPTSGPGITEPVHSNEGSIKALEALFGNSTLRDVQTTCLNPVINMETGGQITFITDRLNSDETEIGYTSFSFANPMDPVTQMQSPDTQVTYGVDFRLDEVALACAAGPTLFSASNVTSTTDPNIRFLSADGFLGISGDTTFQSLGYAGNRMGTNSIENFAILSLGQGKTVGIYADNANGGIAQWFATTENIQISLFLGGDDTSNQMKLLYSANPNVESLQYLRIQTFADAGTERGDLFADFDVAANVPALQQIGEELAGRYANQLQTFVNTFVFS